MLGAVGKGEQRVINTYGFRVLQERVLEMMVLAVQQHVLSTTDLYTEKSEDGKYYVLYFTAIKKLR